MDLEMYLSYLLINVGDNPDRPRPGRLWLRNLYHVHQRLCMAFPSDSRKQRDPDFLAPYTPDDFPEQRHLADKKKTEVDPHILKQVHSRRNSDSGFLFRIDPWPGGRTVILVQSAVRPDWDYAFHNADYLLAASPEVKPFDPCFTRGQSLRFRLATNPTRRLSRHSLEHEQPIEEKWIGKRIPVPSAAEIKAWQRDNPNKDARLFICYRLFDWLACKAEGLGFSIEKDSTTAQTGYIYMSKTREGDGHRLRSVRYEGILKVIDADNFRNTLIRGIGSGKAFGFGLLSVAPVRSFNPSEAT